jgi:hypothetical protein
VYTHSETRSWPEKGDREEEWRKNSIALSLHAAVHCRRLNGRQDETLCVSAEVSSKI